jgi:UDP-N-acetylmuramoyl-L-alanine---L-glutamate ligase
VSLVVVVGLGRETRDWLAAGHAGDAEVVVVDGRPGLDPADPLLAALPGRVSVHDGVDLDQPLTTSVAGLTADVVSSVVRSPGVSPYRRALADLVAADVPTVTPTGWWLAHDHRPGLAAITGTKGKSTTAAMTAHVLRAAGHDVALCGNIGRSPLTGVADPRQSVVIELSSYQLADLDARIPVAGLTTLLQDHVPWHGSIDRYHADKLRLFDLADRRLATRTAATHPAVAARVDAVADVAAHRPRLAAAVHAAGLVGDHLVDDAALAVALADAVLVATDTTAAPGDLLDALRDFAPLPHRLTPLGWVDGRRYVDDSISTVPEAALAALAAYLPEGPVTMLVGGDDRGQQLDALAAGLADERVHTVLLPPFGDRLAPALAAVGARASRAADLAEAVALAATLTPAGGTVVLSPAAPSFGSHRDFVHRGEHFTDLVHELGTVTAHAPSATSRRIPG